MIITQSVFFVLFYLFAQFGIIKSFVVILLLVLIVGLNEGAVYVFGYYQMYEDKKIDNNYRELCLNISFNFSDTCLITSSLFALLLDNTILKV